MSDNRPTDVSIDIETLGKSYGAAVLSIGAASFNRHTGKLGPTYYVKVQFEDALRFGRVDASTLQWWAQQGQVANKQVFGLGGELLTRALQGLNAYLATLPANVCVWGNGPTFDMTLLEAMYAATAIECPWNNKRVFWTVRDLRTIIDVAEFDKRSIPFTGTPHYALDDAIHQAKIAVACFQKLLGFVTTAPKCSLCGGAQFETPSGIICVNGHGGAQYEEEAW